MLFEVLRVIALQVSDYTGKTVTLGNVALIDDNGAGNALEDTIILSLVNMNEENTMKNFMNTQTVGSTTLVKQPVINLNLFIMFCSNRGVSNYRDELIDLAEIVEFFQGKKVFTQSNSIYPHGPGNALGALNNFKFHVELYTPSFEEQSYIWGSLGGKQRPSAVYKVSVVQIESDAIEAQGGIVTETDQTINQL